MDRISEIATPDDVTEDDCDLLDSEFGEGIDLTANAKVQIRTACEGRVKPIVSASRTRITGGGGGFALNRQVQLLVQNFTARWQSPRSQLILCFF